MAVAVTHRSLGGPLVVFALALVLPLIILAIVATSWFVASDPAAFQAMGWPSSYGIVALAMILTCVGGTVAWHCARRILAPAAEASPVQDRPHDRLIAETMTDVAVLRRLGARQAYVSPSVQGLLGCDAPTFLAQGLRQAVHPDDLAAFDAVEDRIGPEAPSLVSAFRARHRDGRWIWVEAVHDFLPASGPGEANVLSTLRDITGRRYQADELRMARDAAELAQAKAENTNRAKSEFIGLMSHEIRTPLTTIKGLAELLTETGILSADQRRHLGHVCEATETLLVAVDDILDFAKAESGDLQIAAAPFALPALVTQVADLVRPVAEGKGLTLTVYAGRELPSFVLGDERRLRQILLNLLNDAVGTAQDGAVGLSVTGPRGGDAPGALRFAITASIPDAGSDTRRPRSVSIDGSGLGLTVSQRLVGLMGGRLERATRPGEAAAYRFTLPLPPSREPLALVAPAVDRSARVLVVEDSVINQEIVRAMLARSGYAVDLVESGEAAIAAVQSRTYDLVLMDVLMPGMDGMTATRRIRALQHPARRVPIVAMTANVMPDRVRAFLAAGMNACIAKPFNRTTLSDAVATQLSSVVLLDSGETSARPSRPAVFDRACYDALRASLGVETAQTTLRAFVALVGVVGDAADDEAARAQATEIAAGAIRLGFLDLANAYTRLAGAADATEVAAASRRCRIARDLAQRTFHELTGPERPDVSEHVALL